MALGNIGKSLVLDSEVSATTSSGRSRFLDRDFTINIRASSLMGCILEPMNGQFGMEKCSEDNRRQVLYQQPSQCLVIDLGKPYTKTNSAIVAECLCHVLPIVGVLPGPPRVPLLGIVMANNGNGLCEEIVLGFEKVRGNVAKCVEAVRSMHTEFQCASKYESQSISAALMKAFNLYKVVSQKPNTDHELEITIISSSVGYKVRDQVLKALSIAGSLPLKSVTILSLVHLQYNLTMDELEGSGDEELDSNDAAELLNIQYILLDNTPDDALVLKKHFMGWLTDCSKDSHHMELSLPHPYNEGEKMKVKFDLKEWLLPTSALPFHNTTSMELTATFIKPPHFATKADGAIKYSAPIHLLKVIRQVPFSGSLVTCVYGAPMVLEATQCWKVDWDELESNKSTTAALHSALTSKNVALLCQLEVKGEGEELSPCPYYCIVPAGPCLLIHHVAYQDILLYPQDVVKSHSLSPEFQQKIDMEMSLKKVNTSDGDLDPQGLTNAGYIKHITKSLLPKRLTNRKRPLTSSNSAKRKAKYLPLIVPTSSQPMEVSSSTRACAKTLSQGNRSVHSKAATSLSSSHCGVTKLMPLPVLKTPSEMSKGYMQPSIASQLQDPPFAVAEAVRETPKRWLSRDDSQPLPPTCNSLSLANKRPTSLPSSYKKLGYSTQSSMDSGLQRSIDEFLYGTVSNRRQLQSNLSPSSPMQYDGLSQSCEQPMQQSPCDLTGSYPCQSFAETSLDIEVSVKPSAIIRPVVSAGTTSLAEGTAAAAQVLQNPEDVSFIEHADGVLSPGLPDWNTE